jgi:hypothetical protein
MTLSIMTLRITINKIVTVGVIALSKMAEHVYAEGRLC